MISIGLKAIWEDGKFWAEREKIQCNCATARLKKMWSLDWSTADK
jgi:hypothetical protein